ncbi:hypothetical protein GQX74_002542 [Glossina fuscipes]|nr:hypothetical protein GQX74_002542 [Glossina fuscipes]
MCKEQPSLSSCLYLILTHIILVSIVVAFPYGASVARITCFIKSQLTAMINHEETKPSKTQIRPPRIRKEECRIHTLVITTSTFIFNKTDFILSKIVPHIYLNKCGLPLHHAALKTRRCFPPCIIFDHNSSIPITCINE